MNKKETKYLQFPLSMLPELILNSEETLLQFKKAAFEVAKKFDIKNILPLYEELYNKAINLDS